MPPNHGVRYIIQHHGHFTSVARNNIGALRRCASREAWLCTTDWQSPAPPFLLSFLPSLSHETEVHHDGRRKEGTSFVLTQTLTRCRRGRTGSRRRRRRRLSTRTPSATSGQTRARWDYGGSQTKGRYNFAVKTITNSLKLLITPRTCLGFGPHGDRYQTATCEHFQ